MESQFVQMRLMMDLLMIAILQVSAFLIFIGIIGIISDWILRGANKKFRSKFNWHKTLKLGLIGIVTVFIVFFIYLFSSLLINLWDAVKSVQGSR